jgi:CRP-like cAMP-binding protein
MNPALRKMAPMDVQTFYPDEIILFPGDAQKLYRLLHGLVRIHTVDDEGNGLTLRYVKPTGYFGEESIGQTKRRYFAEAVTHCEVEIIEPDKLSSRDSLDLNVHLAQLTEKLYRSLYRLSGKRLKSRLAAELIDLQDSALATLNTDGKSIVHITHDALAAAVGSVRETVTKVVGELAKTGAIDAGYGKIILNDKALLQKIADE